jgi:hypothetical protein
MLLLMHLLLTLMRTVTGIAVMIVPCMLPPFSAALGFDTGTVLPVLQVTYRVLEKLGRKDPLLDIAMELEKIALQDDYFVKR